MILGSQHKTKRVISLCAIFVICLFGGPGQIRADIVAGPFLNPANGQSYCLLDAKGWLASEEEAIALGGHLATVRSADENEWIWTTFQPLASGQGNLWIGLNDAQQEGAFVWSSGEPVTFTNWSPGEPNNVNTENYAHIVGAGFPGHAPKVWNDIQESGAGGGGLVTIPHGVVEGCRGLDLAACQVDQVAAAAESAVCRLLKSGLTRTAYIPPGVCDKTFDKQWLKVASRHGDQCPTDPGVVAGPVLCATDRCVKQVGNYLRPSLPAAPSTLNCAESKLKAATSLLKCHQDAIGRGASEADSVLVACEEKAKTQWEKAEQRYGASCPTLDDWDVGQALVVQCVDAATACVQGAPTCDCDDIRPAPDLIVTDLSSPPAAVTPGDRFRLTDTVANQGAVEADSSTVRYYLEVGPAKTAAAIQLTGSRSASLAVAAASRGSVQVAVPSDTPLGLYHLFACADDTQKVRESMESNNCLPAPDRVTVTLPNRAVTTTPEGPVFALPGASWFTLDTVANLGVVEAPKSKLRYFFSRDAAPSSIVSGTIGERDVPALAPGDESRVSAKIVIPSSMANGFYYFVACINRLPGSVGASKKDDLNPGDDCRVSTRQIEVCRASGC